MTRNNPNLGFFNINVYTYTKFGQLENISIRSQDIERRDNRMTEKQSDGKTRQSRAIKIRKRCIPIFPHATTGVFKYLYFTICLIKIYIASKVHYFGDAFHTRFSSKELIIFYPHLSFIW